LTKASESIDVQSVAIPEGIIGIRKISSKAPRGDYVQAGGIEEKEKPNQHLCTDTALTSMFF
jgi:hypothetical protein